MKVVAYSLFAGNAERFEKLSYLRGFYWNSRMNVFLYPEWRTHLEIDRKTYEEFKGLFDWLVLKNSLLMNVNESTPELCEGMMWRMKPIFQIDVTHVLCRDADSITTYKEAQCIQQWLESGLAFHAINDNQAHGGLMGGMVGFTTSRFKNVMGFNTWDELVAGFDLKHRGSDQHLLNQRLGMKIAPDLFLHQIAGSGCPAAHIEYGVPGIKLPLVDERFWESDLTCRHIGSAGVVDMEVIRFFKRMDEYQYKFDEIEREFKEIFYWQ